jgi:AcrR family transcriptional regulator
MKIALLLCYNDCYNTNNKNFITVDIIPVNTKQSKPKLVAAAADLMRRRGVQATSVRELARHANAPLGSVYHYFPNGKAELLQEAIAFTAQRVEAQITECLALGAVEGFKLYFAQWRSVLTESAFAAGCPLAAISLDAQTQIDAPAALALTGQTFQRLQTQIAASLSTAGIADTKAQSLATSIIAITEGAILICRAQQNLDALFDAETTVLGLIGVEL